MVQPDYYLALKADFSGRTKYLQLTQCNIEEYRPGMIAQALRSAAEGC